MTIQFLCFTCFVSNGTSVIAEIHRVVMNDPAKYRYVLNAVDSDMWVFLKYCNKKALPGKNYGSCSNNRYKYHITKDTWIEWNTRTEDLFKLIQTFAHIHRPSAKMSEVKLKKLCHSFIHELKTKKHPKNQKEMFFKGAGHLGALQFLQMCGIFGLVPLYCATYAEINSTGSLGPTAIMRLARKENEENRSLTNTDSSDANQLKKKNLTFPEEFFELHKDLVKIWGALVTLALLENLLCECHRSYKRTCQKYKKNSKSYSLSIIEDPEKLVESKVCDLIYMNQRRKCVQNFYALRLSGNGASKLRPSLHMKVSSKSLQKNHTIAITNWCDNCRDEAHLSWSDRSDNRSLQTTMRVSDELREIFSYK